MNTTDTNSAASRAPSAAESQLLQSSLLMMAQAHGENVTHGPPGLSSTPTMSGLLHALKRRWGIAMGVAIAATASAVLAVFFLMPPKFNVEMRMRVVARNAGAEDIEFPIFKANMEALVKSPLVLNAALNDKTADGKEIKDLELVRSKGMSAIDWLEKKLKTDFLLGPEVLRVTLAADQADEAAQLLNAIAKAFLHEYAEMERSKKQHRLEELRKQKERLEEDLRKLRIVLEQQYRSLDVKDREAAQVQLQQWLNKLSTAETTKTTYEAEMAKAESEIVGAKVRLKNVDKQQTPDEVLYELYVRDQTIQGFQKRINDIEQLISEYYTKYEDPYASQYATPLKREKIKILAKKLEREEQLKPEIENRWRKRVREDLEHQIVLAEEKRATYAGWHEGLLKKIQEYDRRVKESGPGGANKPPTIAATEEKIELAKTSLNHTGQKISEVELELLPSRILPLQRASQPLDKDRTQQTKIAGAGGLGIFMLALFGVAFFEFRSRKISQTDEVSHGLGLNVVGTIPAMPIRSKKSAVNDPALESQWAHQLQESVDAIRTVILHQARSESLHVLMITSASSSEGKTTLATQLAASMSRAWKRTLIIDADLRHPATHALFDTPQEPGLAEVLRGEVEPADAIRATSFSRLWVLPAGNGDNHALQALAQDNVRTLFEQLKQQYDFIIIDAPPVLPVTDSLLIGQHVDGVLFAILSDVSRTPAVYAAQQKLAPLKLHTLGAVVLGAAPEFNDKNYRYALSMAK